MRAVEEERGKICKVRGFFDQLGGQRLCQGGTRVELCWCGYWIGKGTKRCGRPFRAFCLHSQQVCACNSEIAAT